MGLFDEVKQNVTVRQAAERYGLKPNRSGLIRCIFHNDKSPSMKVDRRYYCFGCGCTGDAIDFTAQLFDIGLKDAAMKLADDFGIPYSGRDRGSPQNRRSVSAKKPEPTPEELWQKKHLRCLRAYLDYLSLLLEWKEQYAPKTRTEEWHEKFMTALRELSVVEYYLDILDDEKEARSYFDQLWAEVMEIYWSTENKSSLLKFSKEMEQEISEYRKQFTQEDTMAGMIQGWLDAYKGSHVCSVQIWKEAFDHFDREPKKFETNEICSIMDTQITGWKRAGVHRFSKEGYGRQRSWIREGAEEEGGNEPDKDGFTKLTKAEQLELPFDLPDREKG